MKTHYEIIGVKSDADTVDIKAAAQAQNTKIKTIFATLSNAEKRKAYDASLSAIPATERNYYEILAISLDADIKQIKSISQTRLGEIKTAFQILTDTEARQQYDLEINSAPQSISMDIPDTPYAPPATLNFATGECSACNAMIYQKAEICPKCGVRHRRPARKLTLLLLTLFTGGFGVHRFYLGNYLWGIIYLLFCWTFIPTLLSWIEYIIFIFKSQEKIEENYESHDAAAAIAMTLPILLFFIGIIAAISIPAYTDYMHKAKVGEATFLLDSAKTMVEERLQEVGTFPSTSDLKTMGVTTSSEHVLSIEANVQQNYLQATMRKEISSTIAGKTIRFTYDPDSSNWKCAAGSPNGMKLKYLPPNCR